MSQTVPSRIYFSVRDTKSSTSLSKFHYVERGIHWPDRENPHLPPQEVPSEFLSRFPACSTAVAQTAKKAYLGKRLQCKGYLSYFIKHATCPLRGPAPSPSFPSLSRMLTYPLAPPFQFKEPVLNFYQNAIPPSPQFPTLY